MNSRRLVSGVIAATLLLTALVALPAAAAGPAAPTELSATAGTNGTVHFEWTAAPGASAYRLEWSADPGFPSGSVTVVDTYALDYVTRWHQATATSTDIYWRVSSFGTSLSVSTLGDPSSTGLVTSDAAAEPTPIGPGSEGSVEEISYPEPTVFRWEPVSGAVAYELEYTSDTLGAGAGVTTQSVNGTQFAPANPLARVDSNGDALTWKWRVRAQYYNGTSSASPVAYGPWSAQRDFQIVWDSQPSNLYPQDSVTTVHSDLAFSWDAVPGAAKYRVSFGNSIEGSGSSARILNPVTRDVYATTFIPTAQVADNTRYWQVTPLDYANNLGTPSDVHQYRKKWGTQDAASAPLGGPDAAPTGITGSLADDVNTPETYLSDFIIEWEPLPRATFYMLEVRDNFANVYYCRTAATSATIVADYEDGLNNSGSDQVLQSAGDCLWNTDSNKRIQQGRTYNWRVRAIDFTGSSTTAYQQSSATIGTLPAGVQLSNWSTTRYVKVKVEDRTPPTTVAVDLDLESFVIDNTASESGQPAPLLKWSRAGQLVSDVWWPAPAYEVILYKNPERTTEIGHFLTPSTTLSINGVLDDNTTSNPYYATVRPVSPTTAPWKLTDLLLIGGVDNNSVENFSWQKESNELTGLATQTLSDGSVRLSWNPQSVTGLEDGGSRGYLVRVFNGATQQGVSKKVEFPFFMAQKPATSDDSTFPSTATDVPLPPGSNYSFEVAPLDANGNPGPSSRSAAFSVGITTPTITEPANVAGGSAVFTWSSVPGALKYSVQYRRVGSASWSTAIVVSQTAAAITGLDQGNYEWQVRAFDAANLSTNVSPWSASQPFSVGGGSVTQQTANAASLPLNDRVLRWSSTVEGATRFQVQVADDSAFSQGVKSYETDATSLALPDAVSAAKQYYWRVKALSEPLSSLKVLATSGPQTFTVLTTPAKLGTVNVSRVGTDLNVAWTPLAGASAGTADPITYLVQYRLETVDGDWSGAAQVETTPSASSVLVTGLEVGTSYQFRVAGKNSEGVGPWSDVKTLATAAAPKTAPNFTVTSKLGGLYLSSLSVSDNGGSAITGYRIAYRASGTEDWTTLQVGAVGSYTVTGLANTTAYDVSVAGINIVGDGPAKLVVANTLGVPSVPLSVAVTKGDKAATVSWTAPEVPNGTITGYVVQYRLGTTGDWLSAGTTTAATLKLVKSSLINGKVYEFRVAAKTSVGTGDFSAPLSVTPAGKPILSTTLTATSSSTGTVTVAWGKANSNGSPITAYIVKYSTNGSTWYTLKTVGPTTYKVTSTKGVRGKRVYFRLYAKNSVGTSAYKSVSVIRK